MFPRLETANYSLMEYSQTLLVEKRICVLLGEYFGHSLINHLCFSLLYYLR